MTITMHDLFAGAGGSSTGAISVPGVTVRLAANHWDRAIAVHNANHPDTDHLCADISQYEPRRLPGADILWASPECTNHSRAKGRKKLDARQPDIFDEILPDEAAERSRATMWDVVRFTEAHRYHAIIVENVVEARQWEPFQAWLSAMDSYGYDHQIVYLNSMHAQAAGLPAPQSRDRMYVVFWRRGNRRPDLDRWQRPRAYCPTCDEVVEALQSWKKPESPWGRYRAQYLYRCPRVACRNQVVEPGWLPAAAAIDWTLPGQRIGDRARPLADKTRRRIAAGIARYWSPIHLEAAGHTYDAADPKHIAHDDPNGYYRAWSTYDVLRTLHTIESKGLAVPPLLTPVEGREGKDARPWTDVMRTQTTRHETGLAFAPFIAELRGGGSTARAISEALATVTASGNHHLLVTNNHQNRAREIVEPLPTATTGNAHALLTSYYGSGESAARVDEAMRTLTTRDRHALVTPAGGTWNDDARTTEESLRTLHTREAYGLVMRNNGTSEGGDAWATTPASEVLRTLTTKGHQSLITPGDLAAAEARVDDCLFRMLEPHEVAAGMAFPTDYLWEGTRRERVKMAGNAVTPPAARDLISAVVESLEGAS